MKIGIRTLVMATLVMAAATPAVRAADRKQSYDELIQEVLELSNKERARFGLHPLKLNPELSRAAEWMAEDMARKDYFSHTDSQGRGIGERVPTFGYTNYALMRENLAAGHFTAREVVDAWMQSKGHRESLLCPRCDEIGIAYFYFENSKYKRYWVQEFGKQRSPQKR